MCGHFPTFWRFLFSRDQAKTDRVFPGSQVWAQSFWADQSCCPIDVGDPAWPVHQTTPENAPHWSNATFPGWFRLLRRASQAHFVPMSFCFFYAEDEPPHPTKLPHSDVNGGPSLWALNIWCFRNWILCYSKLGESERIFWKVGQPPSREVSLHK